MSGSAAKAWEGARKYGIEMRVGPVSITNGTFGNRPHCIYRGFCLQGCKVNAKASPLITHLPDAIEHGVEVRAESMVMRVEVDDSSGRCTGVTYLTEGREVLVSRGAALESVIAAASIPGVFPPVRIGDLRLVDGGVVNNSPISRAVELGAERIYVLPTGEPSNRRLDSAPKTALDAAIHGVQLLVDSRLEADIARYAPSVELLVLPAPNASGVQPTSFEHSDRLMRGARVAARATLARQILETPLRLVG